MIMPSEADDDLSPEDERWCEDFFIALFPESDDVLPTATCSLDGCGFTFPHFHRDTLDGEEVVRVSDADHADVLPTQGE